MSRLYDGFSLDTNWIKVTRQTEARKIISTLMDGTEHIQIIGSEVTKLDISLVADAFTKDRIDAIDVMGGTVYVIDNEGNEWQGVISRKSLWGKFSDNLYQGDLTISVEVI